VRLRWLTLAGLALMVLGAGFQQLWLVVVGAVLLLADLVVRSRHGYKDARARRNPRGFSPTDVIKKAPSATRHCLRSDGFPGGGGPAHALIGIWAGLTGALAGP
jgi:hypothetical protein